MDSQDYSDLYRFLHDGDLPEGYDFEDYHQYADQYKLENAMIFTKESNRKLVQRHEIEWICSMFHDDLTAAHMDFQTTYTKIAQHYIWENMRHNIQAYVQSCDSCQRQGKSRKQKII